MSDWRHIRSLGQESVRDHTHWLQGCLDESANRLLHRPLAGELYRPLEVIRYRPAPDDLTRESQGRRSSEEDDRRGWENENQSLEREKPRPAMEVLRHSCVILGDPGAGKSELLRHAVRDELQRVQREPGRPVPIYLRVADLVPAEKGLKGFASKELQVTQVDSDPRKHARLLVLHAAWRLWADADPVHRQWILQSWWRSWTEGRSPLLALDGWDEAGDKPRLLPHLRLLLAETRTVLTSRIVGYDGDQLRAAREWRLQPLGLTQAQAYVKAYLPDRSVAEMMAKELERKPAVGRLAGNPLALTLMCRVYAQDTPVNLPFRRGELYERLINDLLGPKEAQRRGANAQAWLDTRECKREFLEQLAWERYPAVVAWRATDLGKKATVFLKQEPVLKQHLRESKRSLPECLMHEHGLLVPYGAGSYALLHKALLDYLAACHLARQINAGGFDAEITVLEKGKEMKVAARHFLNRKAWSPAHQEMITLLGGRVKDAPALITLIKDEEKDDSLRRRFCLAARIAAEMTADLAHGCELIEDMAEQLFMMIVGRQTLAIECTELLAGLCTLLGPKAAERLTVNVRGQIESAANHGDGLSLVQALGSVAPRLSKGAAETFASRLLAQFESATDDGVRRLLVDVLCAVVPRLAEGAAETSASRLLVQLESATDDGVRSLLVNVLCAVVPRLAEGAAETFASRLLAQLESATDDGVRRPLAEVLAAAAPRLADNVVETFASRLLAQLESITHGNQKYYLAEALRPLASRLSEKTVDNIATRAVAPLESVQDIRVRYGQAEALRVLAACLPEKTADDIAMRLLERLESAKEVDPLLAKALEDLKARLPEKTAESITKRLLELLESADDAVSLSVALEGVVGVAPRLAEGTAETFARRLLAQLETFTDDDVRFLLAGALYAVAPRLAEGAAEIFARRLLTHLESFTDDDVRRHLARALGAVASGLAEGAVGAVADRLLEQLGSATDEDARRPLAEVLAAVAPRLADNVVETFAMRLLAQLESATNDGVRRPLAEVLAAVAPRLADNVVETFAMRLLAQLESATNDGVQWRLAEALAAVAPRLAQGAVEIVAMRLLPQLNSDTDGLVQRNLVDILGAVAARLADNTALRLLKNEGLSPLMLGKLRYAHFPPAEIRSLKALASLGPIQGET